MHKRRLETTFGTAQVERTGYARPGHDSLHPLDASLNLPPEHYSLEMRRRVAQAASSRSFDEALFELSLHTTGQVALSMLFAEAHGRLWTADEQKALPN